MLRYLLYMLQLLLKPALGWDDLAEASPDPLALLHRGFMPLCVVVGLSALAPAIWEQDFSWLVLCLHAVITFAVYILTFYFAQWVMLTQLGRIADGEGVDSDRVCLFCLMTVGQMAVIGLITNLVPATIALLEFLPLVVVVMIAKSRDFLLVQSNRTGTLTALGIFATILPVYLLRAIFGAII